MEHRELVRLLKNAVTVGAEKALIENVALPEYLGKADAYRLYGRSNVDRWINEKLIHLESSCGKINKQVIKRKQLDSVAETSNRITYLSVAERKR